MRLRFDLIGAGVLAPGIDSIDRLIERAESALAASRNGTGTTCDTFASDGSGPPDAKSTHADDMMDERFDLPSPIRLPANERRRTSAVARLVLGCAEQALSQRPESSAEAHLVFAADEGVGDVSQQMLDSLARDRPLSPLVFANSVHNAPSGYVSIAHGNQRPASSLSLGRQSFACGLLCAVTEAKTSGQPVLFMNYDSPMPMPMRSLLPIAHASASAWLIMAPVQRPATRLDSGLDATSMHARHRDTGRLSSTTGLGTIQPAPPLASFCVELMEIDADRGGAAANARRHLALLDHRPGWLPAAWASNSSALGIAALGLLAEPGGTRDFSLGHQVLRLSRVEACST